MLRAEAEECPAPPVQQPHGDIYPNLIHQPCLQAFPSQPMEHISLERKMLSSVFIHIWEKPTAVKFKHLRFAIPLIVFQASVALQPNHPLKGKFNFAYRSNEEDSSGAAKQNTLTSGAKGFCMRGTNPVAVMPLENTAC